MKGQRSRMGAELAPLALILGCVVGSLALVVAFHRQKSAPRPARPAAVAVAEPPPPARVVAIARPRPVVVAEVEEPEPPAIPPPIDPTPGVLAKLTSAEAEQLLEASRADRKAAAAEAARKSALAESERWRRREALVHAQLDSIDGKVRKMEGEVDALALERDALERERDARKALAAKARTRPGQAILPHKGPNGTWRRPIVIECTNGMAILQPRGLEFGLLDLAMGFGPSTNPFLATVSREAVRVHGEASPDGQPVIPYIFFVVRPDGIRPYYEARGRLESLGITFGYELADQEWDIEFPDLDDTSTWDGSAPRSPRLASARGPEPGLDEDPLDQVLHPRGNRPAPGAAAAVAAEDLDFPSFPSSTGPNPRRGGSAGPGDADGFAWPATPTPRYITESGIAGPDTVKGGRKGAGVELPTPAGTPGKPSAARKPLDRQGRMEVARADGTSPAPGGPIKDPTDTILAGGPPGGLMPIPAAGEEDGAKGPGRAGVVGSSGGVGTPPTPPAPARSGGFGTALGNPGGGSKGPSASASASAKGANPGPAVGNPGNGPRNAPASSMAEGFRAALGDSERRLGGSPALAKGESIAQASGDTSANGFELAPNGPSGRGSPPDPDGPTGGGLPLPPSPLGGEGQGGGATDELATADRPRKEEDPGSTFVWPRQSQGSDKGKGPDRLETDPSDLSTLAGLDPAPDQVPPDALGPMVEDLGQVGSPAAGPAGDGSATSGTQAGRPGGAKAGTPASPDRSGARGSGGSDPARRMLGQGSPSTSAPGSPPVPPQGLAGLGLGLPNGMGPPPDEAGTSTPTPTLPAVSPRSRALASAMPEPPPGKIHDRTFEVVVVCSARGVIVQPGGYRVTSAALKDRDGLFRKQLVGLVKGKRMANPEVIVDPKVRFLVQAGGYDTYRAARSQFLLSGLDWPATTQVADPDPLAILPSEGW